MAVVMMVVMVHRPHMTITPVYDWRPVDRRHVNRSGSIIVRLSGEDADRLDAMRAVEPQTVLDHVGLHAAPPAWRLRQHVVVALPRDELGRKAEPYERRRYHEENRET